MSDTDIEIIREDGETKGRYIARIPGKPDAELTYSKAGPSRIIIDHTGVPDALRGLGVGKVLVERAVKDAREAGIKVLPLCPFAKAMIEKTPEWQDVL
ncbi:GNAT family N-acetyltransferase [Tepidamorphus sp. 3E244]|uniref:GNAT family N-acetyltransferase n=1 Tax=Tepidamorphus sp. 3E244 TaxID=3385498 RepID=UPI0038FC99AC